MFAEKIRIAMLKKKITIKELSAALGCSSSNVSNKLKRDNFSEKELSEICAVLGCDLQAVFRFPDGTEI